MKEYKLCSFEDTEMIEMWINRMAKDRWILVSIQFIDVPGDGWYYLVTIQRDI